MTYVFGQPLMIDFSGERCAKNVQQLSSMTRREIEAHLETTARACAAIVLVRAPRPKPEKVPRTRRHRLRRDRWS